MATTRIMPLHVGKGRTESRAISDIIDYVANPKKTDNGRLITGYACDSRTADAEFLLAKRQYIAATGRVCGADDVIAYHVRQSFQPGEITPEEANRLGVEFAKRFTKGNHAFVVCTHIDKSHVHNHIIWSAVMQIVTENSATFGAAPEPSALERYHLYRERIVHCGEPNPTERATTSGWANRPSPLIGNSCV